MNVAIWFAFSSVYSVNNNLQTNYRHYKKCAGTVGRIYSLDFVAGIEHVGGIGKKLNMF
jgi:hypothetical protein